MDDVQDRQKRSDRSIGTTVKRRAMQFRPKTILAVGYQMIRYEDKDYEYELTIDEDESLGRKKSA